MFVGNWYYLLNIDYPFDTFHHEVYIVKPNSFIGQIQIERLFDETPIHNESSYRNFTNRIFANRTFVNCRNFRGYIGENTVDFRHWQKFYWRRFGFSMNRLKTYIYVPLNNIDKCRCVCVHDENKTSLSTHTDT